jgi:thioredoxin reductase/Pyruvate/2-oxoacid:ferredoxin oxidoreductase delta subunit
MEVLIENILIYGIVLIFCAVVVIIYLRKQRRESKEVEQKIEKAKQEGLHEPVSLHPVVDINRCIKTGACITACPEKDILGIRNGKATTINASRCVGHGACFHACPTQAITLRIGTEKRGVDLPHVDKNFQTNVPGIYIAGELGGMGLIRNAVEQGKQAVENMLKAIKMGHSAEYDLVIVGAGPAGISGSLTAKKHGLNFLTLEQDSLGGTVFTFPRSKIVMTSAMDLPMHGKVRLKETSKKELLNVWHEALGGNDIKIRENTKVQEIIRQNGHFNIKTSTGDELTTKRVLLSIGRRGSPRKLNVPGEETEKVAYRLLEPEDISGKKIMVVGGGDSAVESALLLADRNKVTLSYRKEKFSRIKPKNNEKIEKAMEQGLVDVKFNTNVKEIKKEEIVLTNSLNGEENSINNDLVYIFAGGELPTQFLEKIGVKITTKFGEAILKH